MILKEKLKIRANQTFRKIRYHFLFWTLALFFYLFITGNEALFVNHFSFLRIDSNYINILLLSALIGSVYTLIDSLFSNHHFSQLRRFAFLRTLLYFVVAFVIVFLSRNSAEKITSIKDFQSFVQLIPEFNIDLTRFLVYFFVASWLNTVFKAMYTKIGMGNFTDWFLGKLNKTREETRIFMFIDMKASTSIAEKLQHKTFGQLVQDVFNDMAMVDNYHGEIYQYLGDGAIISWSVKKGIRNNNCLKAYFAFTQLIEKRARYYDQKYGFVPAFKAGLHIGPSMVLQVGKIRRDISYSGDTINTTARIESMCNEYKKDLLISGILYESLKNWREFEFNEVGNIQLKGKRHNVLIYQVNKHSP